MSKLKIIGSIDQLAAEMAQRPKPTFDYRTNKSVPAGMVAHTNTMVAMINPDDEEDFISKLEDVGWEALPLK